METAINTALVAFVVLDLFVCVSRARTSTVPHGTVGQRMVDAGMMLA
jgi:hypothetical protein